MPSCIIVEDEPIAAKVIEQYLQEFPTFELIGKFSNPLRAIPFVLENRVDLMFLDVQMPGMTGLELIGTLHAPPSIIFTTAYPDYALDGYEVNAIDYLLKPIAFPRFVVALNKARERLRASIPSSADGSSDPSQTYRFYRSEGKVIRINLSEVRYIEAMENYTRFTTGDSVITIPTTMKALEADLPQPPFLRVHRSYIVNMSYLRAFDKATIDISGFQVPIGRAYGRAVSKYMERQIGNGQG